MKSINRYFLIVFSVYLVPFALQAQIIDTAKLKAFQAPHERILFHEQVVTEQKNLLRYDGKADLKLEISDNPDINFMVTRTARWEIRDILYKIEKDSTLNHNNKVRYLRGMREVLQDILKGWRSREYNPINLPNQVDAYWQCVQLNKKGTTIENYFDGLAWEVAAPLTKTIAFDNNPGIAKCKENLIKKYCILHPEKTFQILTIYPDVTFADSLIRAVAKSRVDELYNYAAASNKLANVIRNIDDPFVKTVARMARSKSGRLYFPFLDNIVKGKISFEELDAVKNDSIAYYKLMVKTQMDYATRAQDKDTAFGFKDLTEMLRKKAEAVFINVINGLHEVENPAIRFAIIQQLNAQELYYATVLTDGIIYTSSFTKGVYPLMMQRINQKGDSLLQLVKFDKYRRFIKMAAGYNTLDNFLGSFSKSDPTGEKAKLLMRAFVSNLEKNDSLEDGVDVADSYASIAESLKAVADEMLVNVKLNYKRNADDFARTNSMRSLRGMDIYNILEKLFLSADSTKKIDLTKELGIPPVFEVTNKSLQNDSGRIVMQVFFYGEKSDMGIFNSFKSSFGKNWKVTQNEYWATMTSLKGRPITVYANRALPKETSQDEAAQKALCEYLAKNKISPTITIHRGHSYTAPYTIEQMSSASKIVFLGSCGGYHLIHDVLAKTPDAHIMASKQIGMGRINQPFTDVLLEELQAGKDIEWIPFWKKFKARTGDPEGFEDYIPPYKNLGALYIKAYKIAESKSENRFASNSVSGN